MFDFYAQLISDLIGIIFSVESTEPWRPWDETKTNRTTRRELENLLIDNVNKLKKYGLTVSLHESEEYLGKENRIIKHFSPKEINNESNIVVNIDILDNILLDICIAIENAGDNKTRSSIRDLLLRAVLAINDQLLPEPMENYIQMKLNLKT